MHPIRVQRAGALFHRHCGKVFKMSTSTSSLVKHLKQEYMDVSEVHFVFAPGQEIKGNNINVIDVEAKITHIPYFSLDS